jgi:hypothetical protein
MALLSMEPEPFAEVEAAGPALFDIVHELTIAAAPDAVFEAITSQAGLAQWWDRRCDRSLEPGQVATLPIAGDQIVARIDVADRPEVVLWECVQGPSEWIGTSVAFRIEELPADVADEVGGPVSIVRFWHGGWPYENGLMPRASFQWAMLLDSLRQYLVTGTGRPG